MTLYHYSEDPSISHFVPRAPLARPEAEPLIWTMDAWHSPMYYVPRDCPRVCFWPLPTSAQEDIARFFSYVPARMVVAIEFGWFARLQRCQLYRYHFSDEDFESRHDAGMYVSRVPCAPLKVEPMGDLLAHLQEAQVELRLCPSLFPLAEAVRASSLHFSLIRMRNAQP